MFHVLDGFKTAPKTASRVFDPSPYGLAIYIAHH